MTLSSLGKPARALRSHHCQYRLGRQAELTLDSLSVILRVDGITLGDIAGRLGYHDAASFSRAYHRWTAVPPAYRPRRTSSAASKIAGL
ncbi:hypothetical protein [Nocardia sp. NBC_00403]|uniref:hypothetical protein n=1 Tax=Nocardia sp. NBC_00403 TaxID=2975990 RepID=UPI002E1EBBD9